MKVKNSFFFNSPLTNSKTPNPLNKTSSFVKIYPSFGNLKVSSDFDPVNASEKQLDQYAEIFHNSDIDEIIESRYKVSLFSSGREAKQRRAKQLLKPRIEKIKQEKKALLVKTNDLTIKALLGNSNDVQQKLRLRKSFIEMLKLEQNNTNVKIPNGIFLYGPAESEDKKDFVNWLKDEAYTAGAQDYSIDLDNEKPEKAIIKLSEALSTAKDYNDLSGKRTLLELKNIDKLLTNKNNNENQDFINAFKVMAENASNTYKATLLISTDMPPEDFDSAAIANHRFESRVLLKQGLTEVNKEELKKAKQRLEYLEKQSSKASYYCEENDYDSNTGLSGFDRIG